MASCQQQSTLQSLDLPYEFEGLEGLLATDLKAIVTVLTQRASERLLLTRRETHQLRRDLWNNVAKAINKTVEPLSAERR